MLKFSYRIITSQSLNKNIPIPSAVKTKAMLGYEWARSNREYVTSNEIEIARKLSSYSTIDLGTILEIHRYTAKNRYKVPSDHEHPLAQKWLMYGGEEGRMWSDLVVRNNLPKRRVF
jgi:hypothetical protein